MARLYPDDIDDDKPEYDEDDYFDSLDELRDEDLDID